MILMLLALLPVVVIFGVLIYKNEKNKTNTERNFLMLIIEINILLAIFLIFMPNLHGLNLWGIGVFILVNIVMLIFSKKINKTKIGLIIGIIIYFVIMLIIPVYVDYGHEHIMDRESIRIFTTPTGKKLEFPDEKIRKYIIYYNCYKIKLFENSTVK